MGSNSVESVGHSTKSLIIAICGLNREAAVLSSYAIRSIVGGGQRKLLEHRLQSLETDHLNGVISVGICGALDKSLDVGVSVIASEIIHDERRFTTDARWTKRLSDQLPAAIIGPIAGTDFILLDPVHKHALSEKMGAIAADMESHLAAEYAVTRGIPFAALRVVSDDASHALPPAVLKAMKPDGGIDVPAVMRSLLRNPFQIPALIRTARDSEIAFRALLRCLDRLGPRLMGPDLG